MIRGPTATSLLATALCLGSPDFPEIPRLVQVDVAIPRRIRVRATLVTWARRKEPRPRRNHSFLPRAMVDFTKRLAHAPVERPTDPTEIYNRLDRASDKGPLRPAQLAVLAAWHARRTERDLVVKLHTGEGKTLAGLLVLQSKLNENGRPSLYLCPNLVEF